MMAENWLLKSVAKSGGVRPGRVVRTQQRQVAVPVIQLSPRQPAMAHLESKESIRACDAKEKENTALVQHYSDSASKGEEIEVELRASTPPITLERLLE